MFIWVILCLQTADAFYRWSNFDKAYGPLGSEQLEISRDEAKRMFYFGYDNYMTHAFPMDELDPIHCVGRGPDYENPDNININDVLGDFSLTLVDSLNTLAIMGNKSEFHRAVNLVIEHVHFDKNVTVQVFETTIRMIGSLLSTHLILIGEVPSFKEYQLSEYEDELLSMAHDLANRLLPAFENTGTGLPFPRVNLKRGVPHGIINETCTAGAGSLLLEFGILSRLVNDDLFERLARKVVNTLWDYRDKDTGLLGNVIDIQTGRWKGVLSGLGAGLDSFYEYLLKSYIMFGDQRDLEMFIQSKTAIELNIRRGRPKCRFGEGNPPFYTNVDMRDGSLLNTWMDSLSASYAGVQTLSGDLDEAICMHALYYALWRKYDMLPERYNWRLQEPEVKFYPLRPEFIESTYYLWLATKSPFYQHVGMEVMDSLNRHTRVICGFATVHDVMDKSLEDRMESFFLSETCKYLYLLFDEQNPLNKQSERLIFSTEGHVFPVLAKFQRPNDDLFGDSLSQKPKDLAIEKFSLYAANESCESYPKIGQILAPLDSNHFEEFFRAVGMDTKVMEVFSDLYGY
ncbi:unnamed protein product [Bursaphelenchus okinawaensis]|uniref:alpha-1,2-Mannosidase n=1 Tax=Bursaphelenchus okinawaensis TaxID=465554 RepID=A0A811KPU9_9BILA|nr:unnamed protein product [Bursaphelenchus okinawaensis]CAG9109638.1 unnamed protein product [Bursaphelenchus okinawaensis]